VTGPAPRDRTDLAGLTLLMSGGSRGIGLAIALRAAQDGANVVMLAKTAEPQPRLEGTVHTAVAQVEAAGGRALAVVGDVRKDDDVARAVAEAVDRFGGIDIVLNNASALDLRPTREIDMKKYDLMQDINARGTFLLSKTAIPHLERSPHAHVLTLSPPLDLRPKWAGSYLAYTMAKYGMSLVTLGLAEELREAGVGVNSLWPRTTIATAAVANLLGEQTLASSRTPAIMADAAHAVLLRDPRTCTGRFLIDEQVLAELGVTDLDRYRVVPGGGPLETDLFLDPLEA
jgi:citronellol/citronellal dehydrogenase